MAVPAGYVAIDQLSTPAPDAAVTSGVMRGTGGKHLTIELFSSVAVDLEILVVGPDGTARSVQTEAAISGTNAYNYPIALGDFQIRMTAAAPGWTGYAIARVVP